MLPPIFGNAPFIGGYSHFPKAKDRELLPQARDFTKRGANPPPLGFLQ